MTTHVATMGDTQAFGKLVHVEADRCGLRQAWRVLVMGDGGNWIDPLSERERLHDQRMPEAAALAGELKAALWDGRLERVIGTLKHHADRAPPPRVDDGPEHPRRVLANNVGYFRMHRRHMDAPTYRGKGWPIGSGVTESAVKQFNKRVI